MTRWCLKTSWWSNSRSGIVARSNLRWISTSLIAASSSAVTIVSVWIKSGAAIAALHWWVLGTAPGDAAESWRLTVAIYRETREFVGLHHEILELRCVAELGGCVGHGGKWDFVELNRLSAWFCVLLHWPAVAVLLGLLTLVVIACEWGLEIRKLS